MSNDRQGWVTSKLESLFAQIHMCNKKQNILQSNIDVNHNNDLIHGVIHNYFLVYCL